jgi:integrase
MAKPTVHTFSDAQKYTVLHRWSRGKSLKTNLINSNHIINKVGKAFPLTEMDTTGFWRQLTTELLDDHPEWQLSTCNRVLSAGSTILRIVVDDEVAPISKLPKIPRFDEAIHRYFYFTKEDVERLAFNSVDVYEKPDLGDIILFAAYTGCRITEILKLRVMDVDFGSNVIWVGGMKDRTTKGNEVRTLPISDRILDLLVKRTQGKPQAAKVFGDAWKSYDAVNYWYKRVRSYTGFGEEYCFHCLRHSFATWAGEKNHPKQVQALLGHSQITTTMRYCHATDRSLRAAVASLTE